MRSHPQFAAYAALVSVCFFWGTTYLGIRMALESFPPAVLVSTRFLISGALLMGFALWKGAHIPRGAELRSAVFSGFLTLGIGNGCLALAEVWVPSGIAGLIVTTSPFWLVGIEAALPGGERLHTPTVLGMLVGLAGSALLFAPGLDARGFNANLVWGFAVLQVGCASWSFGSIYQRRQTTKAHPIVVGAVQQVAAGLIALPFALLLPGDVHVSARGVGAVAYLVTFGSIVGYSSYIYALDRLPVAMVSVYPYVNAVVAVALGWLFYREPFGLREALAMGVIFAGVAVVKWTTLRKSR